MKHRQIRAKCAPPWMNAPETQVKDIRRTSPAAPALRESLHGSLHVVSAPATPHGIASFLPTHQLHKLREPPRNRDPEEDLAQEDLRALTPLIWEHVNPYGTYQLYLDPRLAPD